MEFNQLLSDLMKERGWTNYRLAKQMDCSQSTVANWIAGETKPQKATMKRLAAVLGVSVAYLNGDEKRPAEAGQRDELIRLFEAASPELQAAALAVLRSAEASPSTPDDDPEA